MPWMPPNMKSCSIPLLPPPVILRTYFSLSWLYRFPPQNHLAILLVLSCNMPRYPVTSLDSLFSLSQPLLLHLLTSDLHKENTVMTLTHKKISNLEPTTSFIPEHPLPWHPDPMSVTSSIQKSCSLCPRCIVGSHVYLQIRSHPFISHPSCVHPPSFCSSYRIEPMLPHTSACFLVLLQVSRACLVSDSEQCSLLTELLNSTLNSTCVCSP